MTEQEKEEADLQTVREGLRKCAEIRDPKQMLLVLVDLLRLLALIVEK